MLLHSHSGFRWIVLLLLLTAIIRAAIKKSGGVYGKSDKMINLFAMISVHIQVTFGLVMLFLGEKNLFHEGWMKDPVSRFFVMEHLTMMILAMVLITIGRRKAENKETPAAKHSAILIWYSITLIVILAAIPWPGLRNVGAGWM